MRTTTHQVKRVGTVLIALLLASMLSLIAAPVSQGQSQEGPAPTGEPPQADDQRQAPSSSKLLEKAEREGSVRVIVGLRTDFEPEGKLGRSAVDDQRDRIKNAQAGLRTELQGTGYQTLREYATIPYIALELPPQALQGVQRSPRVSSIEEDRLSSATLASSAPIVQAPTMWQSGYKGAGQTVAVLDSGVDSKHPFFAGRVVEEACYTSDGGAPLNQRRIGGGYCPDGSNTQTGPGSGVECKYLADKLDGQCSHGTHVAGIAAGSKAAFSGVANGANIMSVQVFSRFTGDDCRNPDGTITVDPCARSFYSDQLAGLERVNQLAATRNFASVNMSLGGGRYYGNCDAEKPAMKTAIDTLKSKKIATVISSGNDNYSNSLSSPACISSAVSVGNTRDNDTIYDDPKYGSNSHEMVDLLAPGTAIESSVPGGYYRPKTGTSMAAPHVAGAWALLKQQYPTASVDSILAALIRTGTSVKDHRVANGVTNPRINIANAAKALAPTSAPTGTIKINAGAAATRNLQNKLTLSATDADGVAQMRFHNDSGSWTAWETYKTTKWWNLRNAQGIRTVYVQYKDAKGYVSPETAIKDTIEYDTVSPSISAITPAPGARNVPLDASVKITFNDDMNASSVTNPNHIFIRRLNKDGTYGAINSAVTYYASSRTAVLNPVNNLSANATYVVSVLGGPDGGGVKDTAYNELDQYPNDPGTQGHFWRLYTF